MQIRPSGQDRQSLVGRITAEIRAAVQRMLRPLQELQIRPVGVVHEQQRAAAVAELCQTAQLRAVPEIIRAGHIDGRRCARFFGEHCLQLFAADSRPQQLVSRPQPRHVKVQQGASLQEDPMGIPPGGDLRPASPKLCMHHREIEHRPDAEGRTFRGIQRFSAAEERGRILFALPDDALRGVQHIRAGDLRDIQRQDPVRAEASVSAFSLVARHVEADRILLRILPDEVTDRGIHSLCCSRSALAAASMIAHSIRFRNSSQPAS